MMGNVDGPVIEVLASDPDEESPSAHRRPPALLVAGLVGALVLGAVSGVELTRAVQRHRAPAPPPTRLSAAALPPAGGLVTATSSGSGWVTDVDLSVVNTGPRTITGVVASWASPDSTPVGSAPSLQALDRLAPGVAKTARLRMYRSCVDSGPAPPQLLVAWTRQGTAESLLVTPVGLEQVWSALSTRCGPGDAGVDALDIQVDSSQSLGAKDEQLTLVFRNQGDGPLTVSPVGILGGFQATSAGTSYSIGPNTVTIVPVHVRIADCRAVVQNLYAAGLVYRLTAPGRTSLQPTYTSDGLSAELSKFAYRVCARD